MAGGAVLQGLGAVKRLVTFVFYKPDYKNRYQHYKNPHHPAQTFLPEYLFITTPVVFYKGLMKNKIYPEGKKCWCQYEDDPEPVIFVPTYFFIKQKLQKKCSGKRNEIQKIVTCKTTPPCYAAGQAALQKMPVI